ncbi:hypothetical protein SAMN05421812_11637 [Asanoa hainanensis]|uniref:histidine kinase n=1 Tax=Asanoa hainanensis TaxID=560556 RepID=A0A239PBK0_9ACTN|nr:ATP-binding protein [Asanoa hainanensis]SNT63938.1 hypothetical protein SAMN05421812_11637 [Asanoa hainanensis]
MRRRVAQAAVGLAAVGFGLVSERVAYGWDRPLHWLPDLAVGLVCVGAGLAAWHRWRGAAVLLVLTGFTWFAGNLAPALLFWHRGLIAHALIACPGWRPRSWVGTVAIGLGYVASVTPVWQSELAALTLPAMLVAAVGVEYARRTGPARRPARVALRAATVLAAVLVAGAAARLMVPAGDAVVPALLAYEATLAAVAVVLAAAPHRTPAGQVTDLVVELGAAPPDTLRDELARLLGDPGLQIGYWSAATGGYLDAAGARMAAPRDRRVATRVGRGDEPFAVVVHDRAVLEDPALVDAVAAATRLTGSHDALRDEVRALLTELEESRRRLVIAGDEARRGLERRLHDGPLRRLERLYETLPGSAGGHLDRVAEQLANTVAELRELARGLHPRELADGLAVALAGLADRSPVPVRVSAPDGRFPAELEIAVWYVCAEALANAAKHAGAAGASVEVRRDGALLVVRISDDGRGGADPALGTGLRGLADRVEALGGRLVVESAAGSGTRLTAELPLPT